MRSNCDWRRRKQERDGLIAPCKYKVKGLKTFLSKAEYQIRDIVSRRKTDL